MLSAYLFDQQHGQRIEAWADVLHNLSESQMLWLDLLEPSAEEEREVGEALGLDRLETGRSHEEGVQPALDLGREYLRVTALAAGDIEADASETVRVDCFVGENWVLTAHNIQLAVIDDFRDRVEGKGEVGVLDAPSFLAELLEWVVISYLRAFDEIETMLEEFDVRVLRSAPEAERQVGQLIDARRRVGRLRRSRRTVRSSPHSATPSSIRYQPKSRQRDSPKSPPRSMWPLLPPATRRNRSSGHSTCSSRAQASERTRS